SAAVVGTATTPVQARSPRRTAARRQHRSESPPRMPFLIEVRSPGDPPGGDFTIGQALALGALHGPAELLPISSSGHIALIPWLLDWDYDRLDGELRKSFEVVLHAGTAAALLITLHAEVDEALRGMDHRLAALIALSFLPPALIGYRFERQIERHLGTPPTIPAGLIGGAVVMAWADRSPQTRRSSQAGALDALCLGLAQSCALIPGVSRNGATLAAARLRQFTREDANRLSRHVALPVIAGATLLKTVRLARRGLPPHAADRGVHALVDVLRTIEPGRASLTVPLPGHYASVVRVAPNLGIALATDSVGSKVIVAEQARGFDTIGIDVIAMNVNDLICVGAEPLALLDYLAVEQADPEILREI